MFRRRRLFYRIARICMVFIFGLVVAVVIALSQVNLETLRGDLLEILRDATGLQVEIDGDVSWKFSLRPRVELNKIRVPNEDWAKNPDGFTARKIDLTLNLISLLQDRPTIQNVKVYDVKMFIEENDKGKLSIQEHKEHADGTPVVETEVPTTKQFEKYPFADPGLGSVEVRNFVLNYNDTEYRLNGFNLAYNQTKETREYAGWMKIDTKVYPFIISFSGFNAERKIYPMRIALSTGGEALVANVALEGTSKMPIDFKLNGNIPNVAELGKIVGVPVPDIPMMKLNLAGGFDFNKIIFKKSTINVRGSDLTFSGSVDWNNKIPKIVANLSSNKFDLTEVFPFLYAPGSKWVRPKRDLHVFKDIPLYGHEMRNYDLDARADFKNLIAYRELNIQNIDLDVRLKDGRARLDAIFNFTGGDVSAALEIDSDSNGMLYSRGAGVGRNVSVGDSLGMVREYDYVSDLPVNFDFYLEGQGDNLSNFMSSVTGPIQIYSAAPGYAHSELVSYMYGTDFLTSLRHSVRDLFTSKKKSDQIKISCASVNLKLRNGVIDTENGVAFETNAINIRLAGQVDFGREKMKVSLITVPVRGIKLSLTGNVVNAIEITGNLAEPDIKISGSAVAGKVASATGIGLLLAPFTGGLGLVAGAGVGWLAGDLIENWLADDHPCRTSLKNGAPVRRDDPEWMGISVQELTKRLITE